ncbi:MAG: ABC transporter ATP-binding protein [Cyanobacteriota bacterium]|nr:ABC transporter ATP-binding protein [Cyanobacteriota bacterium]
MVQALRQKTFQWLSRLTGDSSTPVAQLLRKTARQHWQLLFVQFIFILVLGLSEACLFATIYRTIGLLFAPEPDAILKTFYLTQGQAFLILLGLISILQVIASLSRALVGILSGRFAASCQGKVLPEVYQYLLSLSYSCASSFRAGDLSHQATIAPLTINTEIDERIRIITEGLLASIYFLVLLRISPWLLLMASALGISIVFTQSWLRPRIRSASLEVEQQRQEISGSITAALQVLRLIHSNASQNYSSRLFKRDVQGLEQKLKKLSAYRSLLEPTAELLPVLAAVILGSVSWALTGGQSALLIPGLATFVLALQRLNMRLAKLAMSFNTLTENQPRVDLLNQLLTTDNKEFRRKGGLQFSGFNNEIVFEDVCFRHPSRDVETLRDINFSIPRKGMVALVGPSGSGKSTIADLLVGLIDPCAGRILVDGKELRTLDLDGWQKSLGVVSQEVFMIHETIEANIAFGAEGIVTPKEIRRAALAASADGFISALPDGYQTIIGEHGHRLSGGQRQRLSLARAMLRNPEILILDEATSALDSHAEAEVHAAIEAFSQGRTVLAIAHRLSTIRHANMILVIDAGIIVERGTHDQLLATPGPYASLWTFQTRGIPIV